MGLILFIHLVLFIYFIIIILKGNEKSKVCKFKNNSSKHVTEYHITNIRTIGNINSKFKFLIHNIYNSIQLFMCVHVCSLCHVLVYLLDPYVCNFANKVKYLK
jgi:hypothetical protein